MAENPKKIGKYEVLDVLGRGAMGVVYRAHDPYVDRPVAIKLATQSDVESTQRVARRMFVNEARSAGRLDHPNVLKVYEAGEEDEQPYMVMEFIDGGDTLRNYCKSDKLLGIPVVMRIIRQSADALDYAHKHGVLHRDIKPANIMLTKDGVAKIGDFGIARRLGVDQTQIIGWFGSPLYMSPEQARDQDITSQSDLFSLGSVFYEMLIGAPPFAAKGLSGLIQKVVNEAPTPLTELRNDIPEQLWRIVKRMLEKDLSKRYKTGGEITADLDLLLNDSNTVPLVLSDEQKIARMTELGFFSGFTKNELKEVIKVALWQRYDVATTIFAEGTREHAFYVIADGAISISINGVRIDELETGECFGEMEYLVTGGRSATVVTNRETTVVKIERDFKEWASLPCQLRLSKVFQNVLIERLRSTTKELARSLRVS
ncbi:MAG: cyclic nucleotide-binding domain-containing protein [Gammaproteobacteria bacterium]|nr:cyclic nucleotide-binding domain-containing protein [Gammaproteobacteria bacterium]